MESSGATLYDGQPTKKSMFKYINKKTRYSNGAVFPFEGSTDLYPEVQRRPTMPSLKCTSSAIMTQSYVHHRGLLP